MEDLRDKVFDGVKDKRITAAIIADEIGIISGIPEVKKEAERLGLFLERVAEEGDRLEKGNEVVRFVGHPKQVAMAEDVLIGLLAKPSGIATAARKAIEATGGKPKIVCGAWKKMPGVLKDTIRRAVITGGAFAHISSDAFVYLDKNYIEMLGGIKECLEAVKDLHGHLKVVQLKGRYKDIMLEACEAAELGAHILFIDTGRRDDVKIVVEKLAQLGLRNKVNIAFGGAIRLENIDKLKTMDIDILDIGRQIVDAPLLDMRLEILHTNGR